MRGDPRSMVPGGPFVYIVSRRDHPARRGVAGEALEPADVDGRYAIVSGEVDVVGWRIAWKVSLPRRAPQGRTGSTG